MALSVLRLCRDSGSYHVQLGGLHMIETFASAVEGDPLREEIIDTLDSFGTDDFMPNASLAEAWDAYGLIEAIGSLPPDQRSALCTLAVLGSPSYGAWNDVLLSDLVQSGDATALPAFQRWATQLDIDNPAVQEVAQCYILAMQGCAQFMTEPVEVSRPAEAALRRLSSSGSGSMRPFRELRATIPHYDPRYASGHGPANTFSA